MLFLKQQAPQIVLEESEGLLMIKYFIKNKFVSKMQCVIESDDSVLIADIIHEQKRNYNKGYGSIIIEKLISYAMESGYSLIHGNLSTVDFDHKERLHHFYRKFGFTIIEYSEIKGCYYGEIQKIITEVDN